jgi:hypothetical protein
VQKSKEALQNYLSRAGVVKFPKKCSLTTYCSCSCVALDFIPDEILPPPSMGSYLLLPCSRRQLLLRCSTSCFLAVVGNCSCVALPPASLQSSATAPALLSISFQMKFYLPHPWGRTSCFLAVVRFFWKIASASSPTFFRASLKTIGEVFYTRKYTIYVCSAENTCTQFLP